MKFIGGKKSLKFKGSKKFEGKFPKISCFLVVRSRFCICVDVAKNPSCDFLFYLASRTEVTSKFFNTCDRICPKNWSRNHFSFNRSRICRREPFSGPLSSQSRQNMSQRAILGTTFHSIEAEFVAERCSRD